MKTTHSLVHADARSMSFLRDEQVELIVTSPPYPMIEMWDEAFRFMNKAIGKELEKEDGAAAFELMHLELDKVWRECFRVLKPGGIACINIGDATRTVRGDFRLFSNHSRILQSMCSTGFTSLPDILWRKETNAPNKFMGSGMLPAGAYVTYEHEYVLIFRKGPKRSFDSEEEKLNRRRSAFFWEERNVWFSDVWMDLKGTTQDLMDRSTRARSGAYPFELPYRLIQMHSLLGDAVLDPFGGTGTTALAAAASARSSVTVEIDESIRGLLRSTLQLAPRTGKERARGRLAAHREFVEARLATGHEIKHTNENYQFPVVTGQEVDLLLYWPKEVKERAPDRFEVEHSAEQLERHAARQAEMPFFG